MKGKRNRKKSSRLLALVIAAVMLFSSMTAYAETDAPGEGTKLTWKNVNAVRKRVGDAVYDEGVELVDNIDDAKEYYYKEGTLLASSSLSEIYLDYFKSEKGGAFSYIGDDDEELTGEALEQYNAFREAADALVNSLTKAEGTYYVFDIIGEYYDFLDNTIRSLEKKLDNGQIIFVSSEEEAPDTASMAKGTYWVLGDYAKAFADTMTTVYEANEDFTWDGDKFNSTRAKVLECFTNATEAYNTLLSNLHEGTMETATPAESLKEVSSAPVASYKEEVSDPPALVNEVVYAGGGKKQSTMEGVYCKTFTAGTIYTDEPQKIMQAAGLSEKEIADGVVIKYFICNSRNKEMNKMLTGTVSEQGYKVLGIMNNDLYKLAKGTITKIKTTGEEISVVLGIPENLRSDQYEFIVMCYDENGALVVMPDLDGDRATITVRAKNFGYWAVGYRARQ